MNALMSDSQVPQSDTSTAALVPGELHWSGLIKVLAVFLVVDVLAYFVATTMLGRYKPTTATSSDRIEALGKRVDVIERDMKSLAGDVSKAVATSAEAERQSKATADGVRRLERTVRGPSQRPKK
jgi:hypothetical protein